MTKRLIRYLLLFCLSITTVFAAEADEQLYPGNLLSFSLYGNTTLSKEVRIDPQGHIQLPDVGQFNCQGQTLSSLRLLVVNKLRTIYKNANDLSISRKSDEIYVQVLGMVQNPGQYLVPPNANIQIAIRKAGDLLDGAQMNQIQLRRNGKVTVIDYKKYLDSGNNSILHPLRASDEIFVPSSQLVSNVKVDNRYLVPKQDIDVATLKDSIKIFGAVTKPGVYAYNAQFSVLDYLLKAGGTTYLADTTQIKIINNATASVFNMSEYLNTGNKKLIPALSGGATIFIPQTSETAKPGSTTIYVMGQVQKPGTYELGKNATFMDAVANAGGPDQYAETRKIRIIHSDGTTADFDLQAFTEGLTAAKLPVLRLGDVIYFPLKTDLNEKSWLNTAPNRAIKIIGAVQKPGRYDWADEMSIMDLISNVGGPTKDADTAHIRIVSNDSNVAPVEFNLKQMIATGIGAKGLPKLKAGDTVVVPELASTPLNINQSVKILGEVFKPGAYTYNPKYNVVDYLLLAGGITHYAAPEQIKVLDHETSVVFNLKDYLETAKSSHIPLINQGATIFVPVTTSQMQAGAQTVYVMGQVQKPGAYELLKSSTFMDAIANAGGPDHYAETRKIRIIHSNGTVNFFDMQAFTDGSGTAKLPILQAGDVIYFPLKTDLNEKSWLHIAPKRAIKVMGAVERPGRYEWADEMSILDLMANVGGPTKNADTANVKIIGNDNTKPPLVFNLKQALAKGVGAEGLPELKGGYTVFVPEMNTIPLDMKKAIKIFGEVFKPGAYAYNPKYTPVDYLLLAGGPTHYAAPDQIKIIDDKTSVTFNLKEYMDSAKSKNLPPVNIGATIFVPVVTEEVKSGQPMIYVMGQVQKPGAYELGKKSTFLDALANAGGPDQYADPAKIRIIRKNGTIVLFDMRAYVEGLPKKTLPNIEAGDVIYVPQKSVEEERGWLSLAPGRAVKVMGAVKQPGRFEWSDEMSLIDLLAHAGGPTDHADIANIRIISNEHDKKGRLITKRFDLRKFSEKGGELSSVPVIKAGYTIQVPELPQSPIDNKAMWTQIDKKNSIYIFGEVGKPGRYKFSNQLNFLDILSAADGPTPKADLRDVHVIDRQGIYPQVVHVNLALYFQTGDSELIPKVLPGDAIYLPPKSNDAVEINTKHVVKVLGEVKNPGRYRFTSDLTILDLLAAAGGPTNSALVSRILVVNMGTGLEAKASVFNLLKFSKTGDIRMLPAIREGDVIYVPNNDEDYRKQVTQFLQNFANVALVIYSLGSLKL
ncbi:SLBB domain-containing protein [Fluoribacter gormanii]|uniref:Polysialic acid transport protein kpsD n=1 Tax=Fluoribacter gormanii TaxID=464 RepID=A0A377GPJ1_9GAMM|nr:SLBB domain-containing protein [Fluoribacter gormanii]KTD04758.1 Polysialic acid transport protein KpsD precursor [Fluoribacter gormanii]SIR15731.1 protein involved in polysaccharide export, contains SLBB domain of the beta-grasp fold [Fluoribacter gormanii]STO26242.1 Polysialic acid transport protein kpsD precursor [Fluoribacter gormanii]